MRTTVVLSFLAVVLACPALAANWPLVPLDSVHPLGNNWGNYQDYSTPPAPYFHNGIDVITPDVHGRRVSAVAHGWVKGWGTIQESLHYRIAVCDTNSSFAGRAEGWLYAHIDAARWHRGLGDEVQAGDSIGYLVAWPMKASAFLRNCTRKYSNDSSRETVAGQDGEREPDWGLPFARVLSARIGAKSG